jgi:hypothetical protein
VDGPVAPTPDPLRRGDPPPGRPVFPISACLALLGLALSTAHSRARRAGLLVLPVLFVGLLVLIGYLYGVVPFYRVEPQRPVPVMAALLVVVVALGYLCARPESSILDPITTHREGGITARRFELLASHGKDVVLFMRREDGRILEANAVAIRAYGVVKDATPDARVGASGRGAPPSRFLDPSSEGGAPPNEASRNRN